MAISRWPHVSPVPKDPDATLDYMLDWSDWLSEGESIVDSQWVVVGAESYTNTFTATTTTVWVEGGVAGETISIKNTITTDSAPLARVDDRTVILIVQEQ